MPETPTFDARRASLGEILVRIGVITREQLDEALKHCDPDQKNLGQILVGLGYASEEKMLKAVSIRLGIPYFSSFEGLLEASAARYVPEAVARRHLAVPLFASDGTLTVAMVNPIDIDAIDDIARLSGLKVQPVMTGLANLFEATQKVYSALPVEAQPAPTEAVREVKDRIIRFQAEERGVVDIVNSMLQEAMARQASDAHLEAAETLVRLRFRVDGMLQDGKTFSKDLAAALIARIKILSNLDITETRLPQDGHLRFDYGGRSVDVRVSTLPTVHGEKAVLRLLDSSKALRKLADVGLSAGVLKSFLSVIRAPNGLILVTGPTGSGKTTTLYAALTELNQPQRNIVTLEDPVEYRIDRLNQVETFGRIGLSFAAGLRAILRQDPNVVLVGEIRDLETAEIALQASMTGHIVFSSLHTNDAVSSIFRLLNMRVEPFMIAAALKGVMAQRLLRVLCPRCKAPYTPDKAELEPLGEAGRGTFYRAPGCEACFQSGYKGRAAVHEWLPVSRALRELVLRRASADDLKAAARSEGLRTLQESALDMARRGETSLEEVLRATREERES